MSELLQAALNLAALGYPVFPLTAGAKTPLAGSRGLLDATTDEAALTAAWERNPEANVGLATTGLIVIDIDGDNNPWPHDADKAHDLAAAPLSLTANGGRHFIFRQPAGKRYRNTAGKLAPKVDTRADGGYIVVPPSRLANGAEYRWAIELDCKPEDLPEPPAWLVAQLDAMADGKSGERSSARKEHATAVEAFGEGQRNSGLTSLAGKMRHFGLNENEMLAALRAANVQRCRPPLDDDEVQRIAGSVARYEPGEELFVPDEPPARTGPIDPGPFPERSLDVPGFIHEVVKYNQAGAYKRQPVLALAAAIILLSVLTGRKITDALGTRTNLYAVGVGESGCGKERARQVNKEILWGAGLAKLLGGEGFASSSGLISAVHLQPAILFQLDEVGRLLKTLINPNVAPHLNQVLTLLLKLFTTANSVFIGDMYADPDKNKTIYNPHVCVYGTTVPLSFLEALVSESLTDGFMGRVLFFESNDPDPLPQRGETLPIPQSIIDVARYWGDFKPGANLSSEFPQPYVVTFTPEAEAALDEFTARIRADRTDDLVNRALWARAVEKARKLALLYACSADHKNPIVDASAAAWAIELSDYLTRRIVFLADRWVSENRHEANHKRLFRIIEAAGATGISRANLMREARWLGKRDRDEVIGTLIESGEIVAREQPTAGRKAIVYAANAPQTAA